MSADKSPSTAKILNDGIRRELDGYPPEKVAAFVRGVGVALGTYDTLRDLADERRRKRELEQLRRSIAKWLQELKRPIAARPPPFMRVDECLASASVTATGDAISLPADAILLPLAQREQLDRLSPEQREATGARFYEAKFAAQESLLALRQEVDAALRSIRTRRRSRPPADEYGLLAHIAIRYRDVFTEAPTPTAEGRFWRICRHVLENALGRRVTDPRKHVWAACAAANPNVRKSRARR